MHNFVNIIKIFIALPYPSASATASFFLTYPQISVIMWYKNDIFIYAHEFLFPKQSLRELNAYGSIIVSYVLTKLLSTNIFLNYMQGAAKSSPSEILDLL